MSIEYILVIHSCADENVGSFHLLAIRNDATINIGVQVFMWTYVFINFQYVPRSGMDGHDNSMWPRFSYCWTTCPGMLHQFEFPLAIYESYYFSLSLPILISYFFTIMVDILVWGKCILLWFHFHFLKVQRCWALCHVLVCHLCASCSLQSAWVLCPYSKSNFQSLFSFFSYKSSLFMQEFISLSDTYFSN